MPDLGWWRQDRDRWELLEFDGREDHEGLPFDARWEDRRQVIEALVREPCDGDGDFARFLLAQETEWHHHSWGFCHTMTLAALLVAAERRPEDVWLLWHAKFASFDTACGLSGVLLLAAGAARTQQYVRASDHPRRDDVLEDLQAARDDLQGNPEEAVERALTSERRHLAQALDDRSAP